MKAAMATTANLILVGPISSSSLSIVMNTSFTDVDKRSEYVGVGGIGIEYPPGS